MAWVGVIVVGACVACGPSVTVSDGDTTTTGTPTTSPGTASTDASATAVDVTTAAPESSTTIEPTTSTTSTSADESSSTGEFECGCPEDTPIGLDDELPDGETAAELLARFDAISLPLTWFAYGDATTTVHIDVEYRGGAITLGPGGEDGCLFLSSPCNDGVEMEVVLVATTDDGWLALEVPAQLRGYGTTASIESNDAPLADNTGTLAMQPLQIGGMDLTIDVLRVYVYATDNRESGFGGEVHALVSAPGCGGRCDVDEECGPRQSCIGNLCFGGVCSTDEALASF